MPNHVTNILTFGGDPERIRSILYAIKNDDEGYGSIDFNKLLPMPPELEIESGSRTRDGLNAYNAFLEIYTFDRDPATLDLLNIPKESEDAFLRRRTDIDRRTWEIGRQAFQNVQKYGSPTWYEWHTRHWGTKWNAYGCRLSGNNLSFLTAWNAPHPIIQKLSEQVPDVTIHHAWADEDIGINCGYRDYLGGTVTDEWLPYERKESIEFAAAVLNADPSDYGLVLNGTATDYIRCSDTQYDVIEICGQQALYSDLRLSAADIPLGMYLYHLRESDHGSPLRFVSLENDVLLNHGGSVITMHPIDLGPNACVSFTEDTEPHFSGDRMTVEDLMLAENTEDEGMGGMEL